MLERILKPSTKDQSNIRRSMKRSREETIVRQNDIEASKKIEMIAETPKIEKKVEIKKEPQTPNVTQTIKAEVGVTDFNDDDMDFSMLDDDENQFGVNASEPSENKVNKATPAKAESIKADMIRKEKENYANLLTSWEQTSMMVDEDDEDDALLGSIDVENAQASIANNVKDKTTMKFWYWDAHEDPHKFPGTVFLFGRMPMENNPNEFKSVCITVENVDRLLYLLPRKYKLDPITMGETNEEVTMNDVYTEFNEHCKHTFKSKIVKKHFAFNVPGVNVPQTSQYMHIVYAGKYPAPDPKKQFRTIAHIFGCYTNPLETFLLTRKIKGPCWLNITNYKLAKVQQSTWCNLAIVCPDAPSISIATDPKLSPPPPLVVTTIFVRTALNPKTHTNEIVMIVFLVNHRFPVDKKAPNQPFTKSFCGFTRPSSKNWPIALNEALGQYKATKLSKSDSERALLSWFLSCYKNIDPDLIVTHDASDCQLDIICDRIAALKIPMWSRVGRLNLSTMPKKFKDCFVGRMICDVKSSAEELIKSRSYDLDTLCQNVLKIEEDQRTEISNDLLYDMYDSPDGILKLITFTLQDCLYVMRIMCELNVLPLALQITNICGNLMSRTLQGGRSERNEYLLLHAFMEKDYIVPDKKPRESNWNKDETIELSTQMASTQIGSTQMGATQMTQTQDQTQTQAPSGRKKPAYTGGLVLEPIKGFYDEYILLMDFNSLYPSIIQEYNICFTTVEAPDSEEDPIDIPDSTSEQGVLPRQIRSLVDRRREVKKLIVPGLEADLKNQYNIRQLALKLTANSMYGCLGFSHSRFYAKHLAALVTQKGRDILMNTKGIVTKLNFEVIYGDTDSIMINTHSTDYDEVFKIGHSIKQAVNKIYRQVELDIDGVYKYMLLLNKKKYAAVTVTKLKSGELVCQQEHKGLDIVRRDWSQISVMAGKMVLDQLLSDIPLDERIDNIHSRLEEIRDNINQDKVPEVMLTITKQLTKNPREYTRIQSMPHVLVALRMNSTKNKRYKRGDMVSYVICEDGTENNPMQRGYHLDELKSNEKLKIDKNYYLSHQIHPVVSRLLKPIAGTDAARIAQCLGLDPSKYREGVQR